MIPTPKIEHHYIHRKYNAYNTQSTPISLHHAHLPPSPESLVSICRCAQESSHRDHRRQYPWQTPLRSLAIPQPIPVLEARRLIHSRILKLRDVNLQKLTQTLPTLTNLELVQLLFWHQRAHSSVVVFVDLAAILLEIVVEETLEQQAGHARPFAHDVDVEAAEEV